MTDVPARFVADPFMVRSADVWYMFFEVLNRKSGHGDIGLATSSDAFRWQYSQIVLDEPYHLSYPLVFEHEGDFYMLPESIAAGNINLYRAVEFPHRWTLVRSLLTGAFADPTIIKHEEVWWLFASDRNDRLRLFWAKELFGDWQEHPKSPLVDGDARIARPAGRIVNFRGNLLRFTQDCSYPTYGYQVRAFRIIQLTTDTYQEVPGSQTPILKGSGAGWNKIAMHHIDAHPTGSQDAWIACVDGFTRYLKVGLGY